MQTDDPERFLRLGTVLDRTGLSRSTLYRKVREGSFPAPLKIAQRCSGWRESEIKAWQHEPTVSAPREGT